MRDGMPDITRSPTHGEADTPSPKSALSIYALKPSFQALLRPLTHALAQSGVTANQVTITTGAVSIALGAWLIAMLPDTRWFVLLPLWMFARMALNAIDGMLARELGQQSRLGSYVNELSDVLSDIALYLPFALLPPFSALWTGIVILLAMLAEYAGALGPLAGASRRQDGPMGKSDRAVVFGALGLCAGVVSPLPQWLSVVMPILAVALVMTIINRVRGGLREKN